MSRRDLYDVVGDVRDRDRFGIRPGEKLHDAMITEDDGRATGGARRPLRDRPQFGPPGRLRPPFGAEPVPEGFVYSSDTNEHWLDLDSMRRLIEATKMETAQAP